jgi:hypothetical protein
MDVGVSVGTRATTAVIAVGDGGTGVEVEATVGGISAGVLVGVAVGSATAPPQADKVTTRMTDKMTNNTSRVKTGRTGTPYIR